MFPPKWTSTDGHAPFYQKVYITKVAVEGHEFVIEEWNLIFEPFKRFEVIANNPPSFSPKSTASTYTRLLPPLPSPKQH
jgi:hypothetical protein